MAVVFHVAALTTSPYIDIMLLFTFWSFGIVDSTLLFGNRILLNPGIGGVREVASAIISCRRGSSIESVSAWHANGSEFDPHVRHILSWRHGHEKNYTTIPGERMCTKY